MATPSDRATHSRATRAFLWIAGVAVLLAAILTAAWFYLASELEERVADAISVAAEGGTEIDCANRDVFGFPFRIGLLCESVSVSADDGALTLDGGSLRTAAQIYRPDHVVAELEAPLTVEQAGEPPFTMGWSLLSASARFWTQGLERVDLQTVNPTLGQGRPSEGAAGGEGVVPLATASDFELHARRLDGDLDLATSTFGTRLVGEALPDPGEFLTALNMTVEGAGDWLNTGGPSEAFPEALRGREGRLRSLRVEFRTGAAVDLSGDYSFDDAGRLSGSFDLALNETDRIAEIVTGVAPELASVANAVAQAVGFLGRREGDARVVELTVDDGAVSLGMIPLVRIPPATEW